MARPAVSKVNPRRIVKGTLIRFPNNGPDEVVRDVSIVLHMASGQDLAYKESDEVAVLNEQPALLSEEEVQP